MSLSGHSAVGLGEKEVRISPHIHYCNCTPQNGGSNLPLYWQEKRLVVGSSPMNTVSPGALRPNRRLHPLPPAFPQECCWSCPN